MIRKVFVFGVTLWMSATTTVRFWRPSALWDRYRRNYEELERRVRVRRMKAGARKKIERLGRAKRLVDSAKYGPLATDRKPRKPSTTPDTEET